MKRIVAQDKENLKLLIKKEIEINGNECDLNHIDVSKVKDMSYLFNFSKFNGDISEWNVSNVNNMENIFENSKFNKNISNWNVSQVNNMEAMFAFSQFNRDISKWNVSNVKNMRNMFYESKFNQDLINWKPINLKEKGNTFQKCSAPLPYWYLAENTSSAVNSYWLNKGLETSLVENKIKSNKIKI